MKLSEYAKKNGIKYQAAWNRFRDKKIDGAYRDKYGTIIIPSEQEILDKFKKVAIYARVSTNGQKEDLERQTQRLLDFANSNGMIVVETVKEIASGMNDDRPKLNKLLEKDNWNILLIENKDRLTRFGINYIKILLKKQNKCIIITDETNDPNNTKEDILNDIIHVIYSLSARIYNIRNKKTKEEIKEFLTE